LSDILLSFVTVSGPLDFLDGSFLAFFHLASSSRTVLHSVLLVFMNLYVSNIAFKLRDDELRQAFEPYGEIVSSKIIMDRETGRSRGFGFVEFANREAGEAAIEGLNGVDLGGKELSVSEARPREDRPQRSFGGGGDRGGYNRGRY
jgi:RNA recognition motif-containing protein